ncbi:hypothetical protein TRFO_10878 [Tritrichomonas foetus]|uniref:Transglutaminase-like domain-containing protein n=1 Tax=Tritrichomonas foetus TaxID=1144522 RepID=A0A1J4J909_9EUKA|nr:hypothetical protein TRFO_10878 [Tritrichomonas foetus]|eukprot:OHS94735.1 hypothetical protein TRFO_10878 [Tritrichomonas foetus]
MANVYEKVDYLWIFCKNLYFIFHMKTTKITDPTNDLRKLVLEYERKSREITEVPKCYVDYFGWACLANALMYKEPKIPEHDKEGISEYMKTHSFPTLESLIKYVSSQKTDMNKLFAIFSWAALNIEYDWAAYQSGNLKHTTLEIVFQTKKAVCEGYALFFREMSKRSNMNFDTIKIYNYSNYAKGVGFDPLADIKNPKSDHASVYVVINGVPFLSEPTWAAGHIDIQSNSFKWSYTPDLFLIPIYKSLCDHYPCDESYQLLGFDFPVQDFMKSSKVSPVGIRLKTESHPFVRFSCEDGYLIQQFSCLNPVNYISFRVYKEIKPKSYQQLDYESWISYSYVYDEIPNIYPSRCRFKVYISFPDVGTYKIQYFINTNHVLDNYIDVKSIKIRKSVPLLYDHHHDSKFIPIVPKKTISPVRHGVAMIRFAVSPHRSNIIWNIYDIDTIKNTNSEIERKYGKWIKIQIPFDQGRYEDQLVITFPKNGRFKVLVYLENDENSYTSFASYYFDVTGAKEQDPFHPSYFLYKGRESAPIYIKNTSISLKPNASFIIFNDPKCMVEIGTSNASDKILLNLKNLVTGDITFPKKIDTRYHTQMFAWEIPEEGCFELLCWINDEFTFSQIYNYRTKPLSDMNDIESNIMNELNIQIHPELDKPKPVTPAPKKLERNSKQISQKQEQNLSNAITPESIESSNGLTPSPNAGYDNLHQPTRKPISDKQQSKACLLI